ncbi:sigma-70 family RNA polymerase sigma factor [Paenibacillus chibensis]|nr:sigma-70 family RNA polymerase sigma factor [Paenibacillus chibensis]
MQPHMHSLLTCCIHLTGKKTDGEDLLQTTLEKAYRSYSDGMILQQAYLKRIAKNTWIDVLRRKSSSEQLLEEAQVDNLPASSDFHLREAFEVMAARLSIRQTVLLLMIDVFGFTAKETAIRLGSTEGAVKEALKRTRQRLAKMAADPAARMMEDPSHLHDEPMDSRMLDVFIEAFRSGSVHRIYQSYLDIRSSGMDVARVWHNGELMYFEFTDPDGHLLRVTSKK